MNRFCAAVLIGLFPFVSVAQDPALEIEKTRQQLDSLRSLLNLQSLEDMGTKLTTETSVTLRESAFPLADEITEIRGGDTVRVIGSDGSYARVLYRDTTGWVNSSVAFDEENPRELTPSRFGEDNEGLEIVRRIEELKTYLESVQCADRLTDDQLTLARMACDGEVRVGMTKDMVRQAWGRPSDVNRTQSSRGTREQWVYGDFEDRRYVYFRGNEVQTIQER